MGKIFHISRIFWVKLSILASGFLYTCSLHSNYGVLAFGYLARFRATYFLSLLHILIEMKTTTVALGSHFDEFIQASVLGGRYTNASEVIRAGLRRLEEDEQKIAALRAAIEEGEASGYVEDFDFESHLEELKAKER